MDIIWMFAFYKTFITQPVTKYSVLLLHIHLFIVLQEWIRNLDVAVF